MIRKYYNHKPQITLWHREEKPLNHHETPGRQIICKVQDKLSKTTSSLFPIKMIAILEGTQSNVQQNIDNHRLTQLEEVMDVTLGHFFKPENFSG